MRLPWAGSHRRPCSFTQPSANGAGCSDALAELAAAGGDGARARVPRALQAGGRAAEGEEEEADLGAESLAALAAEYGEGTGDPFNDPKWWAAAVAEMQAFDDSGLGGSEGEGEGSEEPAGASQSASSSGGSKGGMGGPVPEDGDGWVTVSLGGGRKGSRDSGQHVVSATVEDILRRPQLDAAFGDLDELEEGGEEWEEEGSRAGSAGPRDAAGRGAVSRAGPAQRLRASRRAPQAAVAAEEDSSEGDDDEAASVDDEAGGEGGAARRRRPLLRSARRAPGLRRSSSSRAAPS